MRIVHLAAALACLIFTSPLMAHDMVHLCTQTVQDYAVYRDRLDADNYASVFTKDGVFITPGGTYSGRDEIKGYINTQDISVTTMHQVTTVQIKPLEDGSATGVIYTSVHFSETSDKVGVTNRIAGATYYDRYQLNQGRCEIAERVLKIIMDYQVAN